jgi:hypothetical protein
MGAARLTRGGRGGGRSIFDLLESRLRVILIQDLDVRIATDSGAAAGLARSSLRLAS